MYEDYKAMGFKCGLEIHQRLNTEHKLFCSCAAGKEDDVKTASIRRRQRAVAGELGKVDVAAEFETSKQREFVYSVYKDSTCLVDLDEEPPHRVNKEALDTALEICMALNAHVPDEIEPMRKGVVDGSDTSAFQRTMLVGYDGYIEVDGEKIGIPTIFLEEESCAIEKNTPEEAFYGTNRLGIPLIEIDTTAEIKSPEQAKKVAHKIGMILRVTGKVQRGIGSIRQDVNVSISGGHRTEIKGFQELATMDMVIKNETERQAKLIYLKKELSNRDALAHASKDVTSILSGTKVKIIADQLKAADGKVYGSRLQGFKGLMGFEINPNRRLGSEVSDYAKAAGVKGIIHGDENLDAYGFSTYELSELKTTLGVGKDDIFMLVAAKGDIAEAAMKNAILRANKARHEGVVGETRAADSRKGITRFMRPLPGGARMYPETDTVPIEVDSANYKKLKGKVETVENVSEKLLEMLGNKSLAEQMLKSPKLGLFRKITTETSADPLIVAIVLLERMKDLRRNGIEVELVSEEQLMDIFNAYSKNKITKLAIDEVLKALANGEPNVDEAIKKHKLERITGAKLKELLKKFESHDRGSLMREIMSKYRVNVDGSEVNELLKVRK